VRPGAIFETHYPKLKFLKRGKVRDIYDLGDHLLIVATDRLSAFDVVMPQPIPFKGMVLTQLSNFWFKRMGSTLPNHIVATRVEEFPEECAAYADELRGRSIVVKKTAPLAIECVARGYLAGSGWNEYLSTGAVCGVELPPGLKESSRLPEPIFTPATKAEEGHDENITYARAEEIVGGELAGKVSRHTLAIYQDASEYALSRGIIIADTKMEFGIRDGSLMLIDELITPDSSRFWPAAAYAPGRAQESFDKQFVRDYLISIRFNRQPPGPVLPKEVIQKTSELYREALKKLTGSDVE
jgi:phosphoribosylaminoimidazole-succinocarboxamide synthase